MLDLQRFLFGGYMVVDDGRTVFFSFLLRSREDPLANHEVRWGRLGMVQERIQVFVIVI